MNPPKVIEVMGQHFRVEAEPDPTRNLYREGGKDCLGMTDIGRGIIRYRPEGSESSKDSERDSLTHEALHAVLELAGLVHMTNDEHKEDGAEALVAPLSTVLLATLRANPELVAYLIERD